MFDRRSKPVGTAPVEAFERPAEDRDLVGHHSGVANASPGERDALIETKQRLTGGRFLLDDDRHVRDRVAQIRRKRIGGFPDVPFVVEQGLVRGI